MDKKSIKKLYVDLLKKIVKISIDNINLIEQKKKYIDRIKELEKKIYKLEEYVPIKEDYNIGNFILDKVVIDVDTKYLSYINSNGYPKNENEVLFNS